MEFDTVRLLGNSSQMITLPLYPEVDSTQEQFYCKGIDGLAPSSINVNLSEAPRFPGFLQSRYSASREVVLRIGLNPYFEREEGGPQTLKDLRASMYRTTLSPNFNGEVTIQLMDSMDLDTAVAQIKGYTRQFEASIFTKDPETQVSIICPNPYLESPDTTNLDNVGSASAPKFVNESDVPVGFVWSITLTSSLSSLTLSDPATSRSMVLTYPLPSGGVVTFDTRPGSRGIILTSGGSPINLLGALSSGSDWLMLESGLNEFTMSSSNYTELDGHYTKTWWGV